MRSLILLLLTASVLASCDRDFTRSEAGIMARRAVVERPELWSVRAAGQPSPTIRICVNQDMRAGFIRPTPSLGAQTCRRLDAPVRTAHGWAFRCQFGGDTYAVSSGAVGDLNRAFETQVSITPLQGRGTGFHQTLRYVRLGTCPAGWEIGQATTTAGLQKAIEPLDDTPAP